MANPKELKKIEINLKRPDVSGAHIIRNRLSEELKRNGHFENIEMEFSKEGIVIRPRGVDTIPQRVLDYTNNLQNHLKFRISVKPVYNLNVNGVDAKVPRVCANHSSLILKLSLAEQEATSLTEQKQTLVDQRDSYQSQIAEKDRILSERTSELERLTLELGKVRGLFGAKSRGDLYVREIISLGKVDELKKISRDYESAFRSTSFNLEQDINEQIFESLRREKTPFEDTPEYLQRKDEVLQAKAAIEQASTNKFINSEEAKRVLVEVEELKKAYDSKKVNTELLKIALYGNKISYLMTTEQDKDTYKINLVMPIENKEDTKEFSELEQDLLAHVHYQWSSFIPRTNGTFSRTNRQGLVQYTFSIPGTKSVSEVKEIERTLAESIFMTQTDYSFGALGLRIDLETLTSTGGLATNQALPKAPIPIKRIEEIVQGVETASDTKDIQDIQDIQERRETVYLPVPGYDPISRIRQAQPSIHLERFSYSPGRSYSELKAATLVAIAESGQPMFLNDLRQSLKVILPVQFQDDTNLKKNISQVLLTLISEGFVEVAETLSPRLRSFKLKTYSDDK